MTYEQAKEALQGYDVRSICQNDLMYEIVIDSTGKNLDGTRRFQAKHLDTVVRQVLNTFPKTW